MKRKIWHAAIWSLLFGIETVAYIKSWNSEFWAFSFINFFLVLLLFYTSRYLSIRLFNKARKSIGQKITSYSEFWYLCLSVMLFSGIRLFTDIIIFKVAANISIWAYTLILIRSGLSFAIPGLLFGLVEKCKQIILLLVTRKDELESAINTLEIKAIHLSSVMETKEQTILKLNERAAALQFNNEMITRDAAALEERVKGLEAQAAALETRNAELLEKQTGLEGNVTRLTALNEFLERDKKVTDMLYYRLNNFWETRVSRYKKILAFYNISEDDYLPGLN
jgi:hypothetical protein